MGILKRTEQSARRGNARGVPGALRFHASAWPFTAGRSGSCFLCRWPRSSASDLAFPVTLGHQSCTQPSSSDVCPLRAGPALPAPVSHSSAPPSPARCSHRRGACLGHHALPPACSGLFLRQGTEALRRLSFGSVTRDDPVLLLSQPRKTCLL